MAASDGSLLCFTPTPFLPRALHRAVCARSVALQRLGILSTGQALALGAGTGLFSSTGGPRLPWAPPHLDASGARSHAAVAAAAAAAANAAADVYSMSSSASSATDMMTATSASSVLLAAHADADGRHKRTDAIGRARWSAGLLIGGALGGVNRTTRSASATVSAATASTTTAAVAASSSGASLAAITAGGGVIGDASVLDVAAQAAQLAAATAATGDSGGSSGGGAWFTVSAPPLPKLLLGMVKKKRAFFSIGAYEADAGALGLGGKNTCSASPCDLCVV